MKLKVDLHSHTNLDPMDGPNGRGEVMYSYQDALLVARKNGIDVLSFTHHTKLIFTKKMKIDAQKNGILLIPGFEAVIEGCDVLLINPTTDKITTFAQLRAERARNKNLLVIGPHPFYLGGKSLGLLLLKHISLFDGIEYCHFHTAWFNLPNWIAVWVARRYGKSLIASSDSHSLRGFGMTYSLVDADKKSINSIISALKSHKSVRIVSRNISLRYLLLVVRNFMCSWGFRLNS